MFWSAHCFVRFTDASSNLGCSALANEVVIKMPDTVSVKARDLMMKRKSRRCAVATP